jgi:hypothetical protein
MELITVKELKEKLQKEKTVHAGGMGFRIRKVPLLILTEDSDSLWDLARQGQDVLAQKVKTMIASPTLSSMRRVFLSGIVQPKIASADEEVAVCVDLLLADYSLSAALFAEIVIFSLEA